MSPIYCVSWCMSQCYVLLSFKCGKNIEPCIFSGGIIDPGWEFQHIPKFESPADKDLRKQGLAISSDTYFTTPFFGTNKIFFQGSHNFEHEAWQKPIDFTINTLLINELAHTQIRCSQSSLDTMSPSQQLEDTIKGNGPLCKISIKWLYKQERSGIPETTLCFHFQSLRTEYRLFLTTLLDYPATFTAIGTSGTFQHWCST